MACHSTKSQHRRTQVAYLSRRICMFMQEAISPSFTTGPRRPSAGVAAMRDSILESASSRDCFFACCGLCLFERDEPLPNKTMISSSMPYFWVYRPAERPSWQIVAASCPIGWDFVTPTPPSNLKANLAISPRPIPLTGRKDWTTLKGGGLSGSPPLTQA